MKRIIIHWSAGLGKPNEHELECYHFLVDIAGRIHTGYHSPEDNLNCRDGNYAKHTGGGNTASIGVSLCGMIGYKNPKNQGRCPITKIQFESAMQLCAKLCKKYNITISPTTVMTHYEFGKNHPKTSSYGKIDITFLPPYPEVKTCEVGSFIRNKILWYYNKTKPKLRQE